jgi:predicted O-linked N-acetylglucosamine transferase (SPINDLY family)
LASNPQRAAEYRQKLGEVRVSGVLFDTPRFVKDLEQMLAELVNQLPAKQQQRVDV